MLNGATNALMGVQMKPKGTNMKPNGYQNEPKDLHKYSLRNGSEKGSEKVCTPSNKSTKLVA